MATLGSLSVKLGLDPSQFRSGLTRARAQLAAFKASINDSDSSVGKFVDRLKKVGDAAREKAVELAKFGVQAGAIASTTATALPYLLKGGAAIYQFGAAAVSASPMLLAFGAAGLFVKTTMTRISQAVLVSFNPILDMLNATNGAASALASKGLSKLSAGFAKVNLPAVRAGMLDIADATNMVVAGTLRWGQSTAGVAAIRALTISTGLAMQQLAPHIVRLVTAFGNMIGRIAAVSLSAGANGLGGALDRLSALMDKVNAATVMTGLQKMKADLLAVWHGIQRLIEVTKTVIAFWHEHRQAIMMVQDALSILAIAFGGPVIAVAAAVGIIIRHWDQLKAAWQAVVNFFTNTKVGTGFLDNLASASATIVPALQAAWQAIWGAIGPVLTEIWNKIQNQLLPALGAFLQAIAPIVAFTVSVLGPVVASVWQNILAVISGVISIISGILNVFAALLTGDWSRLWEGIKQILSGAWEAIVGIFNLWIFGRIGAILGKLAGFLGKFFIDAGGSILRAVGDWIGQLLGRVGGIPGQILSALGDLGSLLYQAGRNVIQGLINGIMSMISAIGNAVGWVASKIRNALPFSPAKEGPLSGRGSPDLAGMKISQMIASGMLGNLPAVVDAAYKLAGAAGIDAGGVAIPTPRGVPAVAGSATASQQPGVVEFRGPDAILQLLRKLIRDNGGLNLAFGRQA